MGQSGRLSAGFCTPDRAASGTFRVIIALDRGDIVVDCDVAGILAHEVGNRTVRISLTVDVDKVKPGTYKAVALSLYDPGPAGDPDRDVRPADAELGHLKFG